MSERIKWIDHEGFRILSADYSGLPEAEYMNAMDEVKNLLESEPSDSIVLIMANVTNTKASGKIRNKGKEVSAAMDRFKGQANAVVGVTGVMKILAKTFVRSMYFAKSEDDAKGWLVTQANQPAQK